MRNGDRSSLRRKDGARGRLESIRGRDKEREGEGERERYLKEWKEGDGDVKRDTVDVYGTRCIGLASREWRWRREKEEKDRVVKLVCRSVTA